MKFLKGLSLTLANVPIYTAFNGDFKIKINTHLLTEFIKSENPIFTDEIKTAIQNVCNQVGKNNVLKVKHYRANDLGRFYPNNSISLISLKRDVKHSCFTLMNWIDIDMIKGHPTILYSLFRNVGFEYPTFKRYINNPDEIFNILREHYAVDDKLTNERIKNFFNIAIYGGGFNKWLSEIDEKNIDLSSDKPHDIMITFIKECRDMTNSIYNANPELVDMLKSKYDDEDEYKIKNKLMSYYCGTIENEILHLAYKFLVKNDIITPRENVELEYDGLCFKKPDTKTINEINTIIGKLNEKIIKDTGLNVKFKIKPYEHKHIHNDLIETAIANEKREIEDEANQMTAFLNSKKGKGAFNCVSEVFEDPSYIKTKEEFQKTFFKLNNPLCYANENKKKEINFYSSTELDELTRDMNLPSYMVHIGMGVVCMSFVKIWKDDHNKRKYESIVFEPNPVYKDDNYYNMFKGFKNDDDSVLPIDENESMFFKLLNHLCSVEPETYDYLKAVISHIIQKPYMKTNIGVILYSETKGVGKDSLITGLNALLGDEYYGTINDIEDITKKFNSNIVNKFLIYSDEIDARARKVADKIKSVITKTKINLEKKGFDPISVNDYSNWWFSTNHRNSFKNEDGDRRNLMIECCEIILSKDFFDDFYAEINDPVKLKQIFKFFKTYKQDKYFIGNGRVLDTKYKKEAMLESKASYYQYVYKNVNNYANQIISSRTFFEMSKAYANKNYLNSNYTINEYGKVMSIIFKKFKVRGSAGYVFKFGTKLDILKCLYDEDATYYRYVNGLENNFIPEFTNTIEEEIEKMNEAETITEAEY
jgi:hypothetical protein